MCLFATKIEVEDKECEQKKKKNRNITRDTSTIKKTHIERDGKKQVDESERERKICRVGVCVLLFNVWNIMIFECELQSATEKWIYQMFSKTK